MNIIPLSPRDSRRLEIALALLAAAEQAVQNHQSADAFLAQAFRESRQFGSKDRKFYSAILFAWFRWKGLFPSDLPKEQAVARSKYTPPRHTGKFARSQARG